MLLDSTLWTIVCVWALVMVVVCDVCRIWLCSVVRCCSAAELGLDCDLTFVVVGCSVLLIWADAGRILSVIGFVLLTVCYEML